MQNNFEPDHQRPESATDNEVIAVGKTTEALEWIERARGHLYDFHQLIGHADLGFSDAISALRRAGNGDLAQMLQEEMVGRNVLQGRWTFQIVEEFDDNYYAAAKDAESKVRAALTEGRRHIYEAEQKLQRRTVGKNGHEIEPDANS